MFLSRNWLKEFVNIPDSISAKEFGDLLTMHTVEVEGWHDQAEELKGVVVGQILEFHKHPDADKLSVAQVDVGEAQPRQIVFGQMVKMHVGAKIPVALAPTTLPGGKKIDKTKMRGEVSEGMLCLEQELGLKEDGVVIHFFDKSVKNGTPIAEARGLNDTVYEIDNKSLTHRPDLWGVYGLAREVAAILNHELKSYPLKAVKSTGKGPIIVHVEEKKLCPRYMGVALEHVQVAPSPAWLRERLEAVDVRSINNVVDLTNYVMLELGQPMHAFDVSNIHGGAIIVRRANKGETIETLDGVMRTLNDSMLVIADKDRAVALAGIMGGEESGVTQDTTTIFLEAANFDAVNVRRSSAQLALRSDASMRFEKALDPHLPEVALARFVELAKECIPGARPLGAVIDKDHADYQEPDIELSIPFLAMNMGIVITREQATDILKRLGFSVRAKKDVLAVSVPSWRATGDINIPEDLVEEISRIYGFDNITPVLPSIHLTRPQHNASRELEHLCKRLWAHDLGWTEVHNYSFVNEDLIKKIGDDPAKYIEIANSISREWTHLRRSFLPLLLSNVEKNMHEFSDIKLFEVEQVFLEDLGGPKLQEGKDELLPAQPKRASGVVYRQGDEHPARTVKELIDYTMQQLGVTAEVVQDNTPRWGHPGRCAHLKVGGNIIGVFGEVHPHILKRFGIDSRVAVWNIHLDELAERADERIHYEPLPKYPPVRRDISLIFDEKTSFAEVMKEMKGVDCSIKYIELFDVYHKAGKKSMAYHLTFSNPERTLQMEDVDAVFNKLVKHMEKKFKAVLSGS
ncbi:MAG TPA: phenylalanine--tRNA ligase subunit beta [Candidatus Magasanikbacteria bacterium]|nr:phenylalanine--tRNA ligase subunit beta [Candidatus Magasanikbacteria bacterium]